MLDRLKALLQGARAGAADIDAHEKVRLAAAALLVEAAMMDGTLDDLERASILSLLQDRFRLTTEEAGELLRDAETSVDRSTQLQPYARSIKDGFDYDERVGLIEMLWEVAYADGQLHDYESNLVRRICGLLYVSDQDSGAARKRALARLGIGD